MQMLSDFFKSENYYLEEREQQNAFFPIRIKKNAGDNEKNSNDLFA